MNGFKDARPDRLPLSASVWDIAQRYNKGGPTVTEALYEALKELEAQVIALQRSEGFPISRSSRRVTIAAHSDIPGAARGAANRMGATTDNHCALRQPSH